MDSSTHNQQAPTKQIAPEFSTWEMQSQLQANADDVRNDFDHLLNTIANRMPPENGRYLSLVKTKLEEACMFAIKGIAKPVN